VGDNQAGFAGVGDLGGQEAVVNLGTSAQISVLSPQYSFSSALETRPFPGGGFLRVYAALCGGWAYAYLAGFFQQVAEQIAGVAVPLPEVFDRMQAFAATPDAQGLCADTRFAGERNGETVVGNIRGIRVMDDFAHHPTAVRETLLAVRECHPQARIIAAFEPRTNSSRRKVFQEDYAGSFTAANVVCIKEPPGLETYPSRTHRHIEAGPRDRASGSGSAPFREYGSPVELPCRLLHEGGPGGLHEQREL